MCDKGSCQMRRGITTGGWLSNSRYVAQLAPNYSDYTNLPDHRQTSNRALNPSLIFLNEHFQTALLRLSDQRKPAVLYRETAL